MNTPTHLLVTGVVFTQKNAWRVNAAALTGAIVPDVFIYLLYVWARLIRGLPEMVIWRDVYWQEPWQMLGAISNSVPLYAAVFAIGLWRRWTLVSIFAGAALLHMAMDFFVHHDDAHRHFWPFTDWKFRSPVSYWDPAHYGGVFALFEASLGIACVLLLWRRFDSLPVRLTLSVPLLLYIAVPAYFAYMLAGS